MSVKRDLTPAKAGRSAHTEAVTSLRGRRPSAVEVAYSLYQALAACGHGTYCPRFLSSLCDEENGIWSASSDIPGCTCGRDSALEKYEAWRQRVSNRKPHTAS